MGHRLFCRRCLTPKPGAVPSPAASPAAAEWAAFRRATARLTWLGLGLKAAFYAALFGWAARSPNGDAALQGIVAADLVTFAGAALLEGNLRGLRVGAGAALEVAILLVFLLRDELFHAPEATEQVGVAFLFFLLFASLKGALHYSVIVLETSGISEGEPASP